jgi:hypothetical protein
VVGEHLKMSPAAGFPHAFIGTMAQMMIAEAYRSDK